MAVYLLVNLYNTKSVSIYKTAAKELFEIVFKRSSREGFVMNPGKLTLASSKSAATTATTPMTAPHIPSKNAAKVYKNQLCQRWLSGIPYCAPTFQEPHVRQL